MADMTKEKMQNSKKQHAKLYSDLRDNFIALCNNNKKILVEELCSLEAYEDNDDGEYKWTFFDFMQDAYEAKMVYSKIDFKKESDNAVKNKLCRRLYNKLKLIMFMNGTVYDYVINQESIKYNMRLVHACTILNYVNGILENKHDKDAVIKYIIYIEGILGFYIKNNLIIDEIKDKIIGITMYDESV